MSVEEELLGADMVEHGIGHGEPPTPDPTSNGLVFTNFPNPRITKDISRCRHRDTLQMNGLMHALQKDEHHASMDLELGLAPLERARSFSSNHRSPFMTSATRGRRPSFGCSTTNPRTHLSLSSIDWRADAVPSYGSVVDADDCSSVRL